MPKINTVAGHPRKYGWRPDLPDGRDVKFSAPRHIMQNLPSAVDLRPKCPPIWDQKSLGACTAFGIAGAIKFDQMKEGIATFRPSCLFTYYCERVLEGTVGQDAGAAIRDGFKTLSTKGACPETLWPYDVTKFADTPPAAAYKEAAKHTSSSYAAVDQSLSQMQGVLAGGIPIVAGFTVYESFESDEVAKTGLVPMPGPKESVLGGHCICIVGYTNLTQMFVCRNSWSTAWGDKGYFYMPYSYLTNPDLASDFWTLNSIP